VSIYFLYFSRAIVTIYQEPYIKFSWFIPGPVVVEDLIDTLESVSSFSETSGSPIQLLRKHQYRWRLVA